MARSKRIEYPGAMYHAMSRGNHGQAIFRNDDGRRLWLATLDEVCEQTGWEVHAYVLMSNHYHLLLRTPEPNLVAGMKWFQGAYTQRFNAMHDFRGHLFQGRYKALPVQTQGGHEYFRTVSNYIHLNPFRAKLCGNGFCRPLESHVWSSYPLFIGKARKHPKWLIRSDVLTTWGLTEGEPASLSSYQQKIERMMMFENDPVAGWRGDIDRQLERGWFVGGEEFRELLLTKVESRGDNLRGSQRRAHDEHEAERLLRSALRLLNVSEQELWERKGTDPEKRAIAWVLKHHTTVTVTWIAERLKMGQRTTASRGISEFGTSTKLTDCHLRSKIAQVTG